MDFVPVKSIMSDNPYCVGLFETFRIVVGVRASSRMNDKKFCIYIISE